MTQHPIQKQLRALRKAQRFTQPQMAARMGVEERTYRSWEKGKTSPTLHHLYMLADSLGRPLTDILGIHPDTGEFPARPAKPFHWQPVFST